MIKKFKAIIKKEFLYYIIIFFFLALIFHIDLVSDPLTRLDLIRQKENYSHPFIYTFIVYSIFFILRKFIDLIEVIFKKKTH